MRAGLLEGRTVGCLETGELRLELSDECFWCKVPVCSGIADFEFVSGCTMSSENIQNDHTDIKDCF